jgi:uncharacterized Tic20 family protein
VDKDKKMKTQPASDEKFWAVLSHLAALAGGIGMVIPAFGWAESRKKSNYAVFQSLQALGYQSLGYTLWTLAYFVIVVLMVIVAPPPVQSAGYDGGQVGGWLTVHILVAVGLYGIYLLFPLIGALMCALGRDFRYPLLGSRLARYLNYDANSPDAVLDEQHEERFAAAMGHFCVIFPLTGLLVPLALWVTQGARSRYMKFQALQTFVFQVVAALVTVALGVLALLVLVIALVPFLVALRTNGQPPIESLFGALIFLICLAVAVLVVPLFQILGQWAGLRILQGHNYRYPLIGRWAEHWLAHRPDVLTGKR